MSAPIDHSGKVFGCLTVVRKASSRKLPSGGTKAYWLVRCECGHEKQMGAQAMKSRRHASCGIDTCTLRWLAPTEVSCICCGSKYTIQRGSIFKGEKSRRICAKCRSLLGADAVRGKPAHNRLPGSEGAFNLLFSRYRRGAKERGICFSLSRDEFRSISGKPCQYCGAPPGQVCVGSKGDPTPFIYSGVDRVSSDQGYLSGNVVACCATCNYMKGYLGYEQFLAHVKRICEMTRSDQAASRTCFP